MKQFSEKIYLKLIPPTEEDPRSLQKRFVEALKEDGYPDAKLTLRALRSLERACIAGDYGVTAEIVLFDGSIQVFGVEPGDMRSSRFGIAVDYGSTTIIMQLVNLNTGEVVRQASVPNGQHVYGTDILTRITYAMEAEEHADDLRNATLESFNALLEHLGEESGVNLHSLPVMIISGNTAMVHFLLGLNAWTVFASPYAPVTMNPGWMWGCELGMDFEGAVYFIPAASNYVGGDIVSGLLTMDFYKKDSLGMFFDIGTNGELVIGNRDFLLAGAGAAGPALEGYISRYGTRAKDGAIDSVHISDSRLHYTTIGNARPIGICGSGIIDLVAQMRLNGWINIAGELNPNASDQIVFIEEDQQYAVAYASAEESESGEMLYFSQTDIKQYLETKAAAHTMVDCLLESVGCEEGDIDRFYLSGAFSAHSNLESAIAVGIFPDLPREKFTLIANSSLDGARTLLLDMSRMEDVERLSEEMHCVQFASIPDFLIRMYAALFIPHTDMNRYPSIADRLTKAGLPV